MKLGTDPVVSGRDFALVLMGYIDRMLPQALACATKAFSDEDGAPGKIKDTMSKHVVGTAHLHNCFNIHHVESMEQCLPAIFVPDTTETDTIYWKYRP